MCRQVTWHENPRAQLSTLIPVQSSHPIVRFPDLMNRDDELYIKLTICLGRSATRYESVAGGVPRLSARIRANGSTLQYIGMNGKQILSKHTAVDSPGSAMRAERELA